MSRSTPRIVGVEGFGVRLPLAKPMRLASETIVAAENLVVRVTADDGTVGWGEAASAPTMTGELLPGMVAAVSRFIGPALLSAELDDLAALEHRIERSIRANTGAKSAASMAVYDALSRHRSIPMYSLLGNRRQLDAPALFMIGSGDADADRAAALAAAAKGYRHFKLKVGKDDPNNDVNAAVALRKIVGPECEIATDANMAWTVEKSLAFAAGVVNEKISYLEQPLADDDLPGLEALAHATKLPLASDEAIHAVSDISTQAKAGASWIGLKLIKLGTFSAMRRALDVCDDHGVRPVLACKIAESSIGAAALSHLAVTVRECATGVSFTHSYLARDVCASPLQVSNGRVAPREVPGHGVEPDVDYLMRQRC
jgi:L-alanine-DL-glutamate epimerase-like enolase superfamily enzyme